MLFSPNISPGDRVTVQPIGWHYGHNLELAKSLKGRKAWVVRTPHFLPMFDVEHVLVSVDYFGLSEIEVSWCQPFTALDYLLDALEPPPPPLPVPEPKRSLFERVCNWIWQPVIDWACRGERGPH